MPIGNWGLVNDLCHLVPPKYRGSTSHILLMCRMFFNFYVRRSVYLKFMLLILKFRSLFVLSVMENYFPNAGSM